MFQYLGVIVALSTIGFVRGEISKKFPDNFVFGVGVAAYQVEGAWNVSGKGLNIWDTFTHNDPTVISDLSNGDVACDSYNLYKRDVEMLQELGVDFYRFSLAWSRILPDGMINNINQEGLKYYDDLIDQMVEKGIQPYVTMYHWDLPQKLQDLGGWASPVIIDHFVAYAKLVLRHFGDRVKVWTTVNEPQIFCYEALGSGRVYAPGLSNPGVADYLCYRHVLLSHAKIWDFYNTTLKPIQKGQIGITFFSPWAEPASDSEEDIALQKRAMQFTMGWQAHPLFSKEGNYPQVMIDSILNKSLAQGFEKTRLEPFTKEEAAFIRGKSDFFGLNYYFSAKYNRSHTKYPAPSKDDDLGHDYYYDPAWPGSAATWLKIYPPGLRNMLNWIRNEYDNPKVLITENGYASRTGLKDIERVDYMRSHLQQVLNAIDDGCNVIGYTAWTLMDNFEWVDGYDVRFGLYQVDFNDKNRTRTPKMSAYVYKEIIKSRLIDTSYVPNVTFVESSASMAQYSLISLIIIFFVHNL